MTRLILSVFRHKKEAEAAIDHLERRGYDPKDLSIVMKDERGREELARDTGANVAGGAVSGATTGAVIGGIAGLLIGVGAIAIPGIGAILIGGPLAAALGLTGAAAITAEGAITGALAGGLIGGLISLGVPREHAEVYERRVREGHILLVVPAFEDEKDEVMDILHEHGAEDINEVETDEEMYEERKRRESRHLTH